MRSIRQIADEADRGMGAYIDFDSAEEIQLDGWFSVQDLRDLIAAIEAGETDEIEE